MTARKLGEARTAGSLAPTTALAHKATLHNTCSHAPAACARVHDPTPLFHEALQTGTGTAVQGASALKTSLSLKASLSLLFPILVLSGPRTRRVCLTTHARPLHSTQLVCLRPHFPRVLVNTPSHATHLPRRPVHLTPPSWTGVSTKTSQKLPSPPLPSSPGQSLMSARHSHPGARPPTCSATQGTRFASTHNSRTSPAKAPGPPSLSTPVRHCSTRRSSSVSPVMRLPAGICAHAHQAHRWAGTVMGSGGGGGGAGVRLSPQVAALEVVMIMVVIVVMVVVGMVAEHAHMP